MTPDPPETGVYDLLIIGGGINGAGIARDAAGRGLKVLLCDKNDLGSATSSASSKLIHGGLRYLEHYEFRLVREALAEREVLLRIAPHISRPLRFVLPHDPTLRPMWMIRLGLFLYDHLAYRSRFPASCTHNPFDDVIGRPLKPSARRGFAYSDGWVDDSRLVILNAVDAAARGAVVLPRCACVSARRQGGHWQATLRDESGRSREVSSRIIVNAAGPWAGDVLHDVLGRNERMPLRLVKGSHILVPRLYDGAHAYILQNDDRRVVFVIPYEDVFSLIGTTDLAYTQSLERIAIDGDEIRYLCAAVSRWFERPVRPQDVVSTYAGVRPLYDDDSDDPSSITRDYVFDLEGDAGTPALLSIFGGKLTTYRRLAEHALDKLDAFLPGLPGIWTATAPLPGGDIANGDIEAFVRAFHARHPWLPDVLARRYAQAYGSRAEAMLGDADRLTDLGCHFGGGLYAREVAFLLRHEFARTAEDVLWRRTKIGLHVPPDTAVALQNWIDAQADPASSVTARGGGSR